MRRREPKARAVGRPRVLDSPFTRNQCLHWWWLKAYEQKTPTQIAADPRHSCGKSIHTIRRGIAAYEEELHKKRVAAGKRGECPCGHAS